MTEQEHAIKAKQGLEFVVRDLRELSKSSNRMIQLLARERLEHATQLQYQLVELEACFDA